MKTDRISDLYFSVIEIPMDGKGSVAKPFLVISAEEKVARFINAQNEIENKKSLDLILLDLAESFRQNTPVIELFSVTNEETFLNNVKIGNIDKYSESILYVSEIIAENINELADLAVLYNKAIGAIRSYVNKQANSKNDNGKLIINGMQGGLAQLVFSMIKGGDAEITPQEIQKVGSVIVDSIRENVDIDENNEEEVRNLKNSMELKIIEALPNDIKAHNMKIDIDKVLQEIRKFKQSKDRNNNDDNDLDTFNEDSEDGDIE